VAVAIGDLHTDIATLLVAKIAEYDDNQFTAADTGLGVVTLTAEHLGTYGNTLKARMNYNNDDVTPIGITTLVADFVTLDTGAGDPDLGTTGVISILENNQFNLISHPYSDNANLTLVDVALTDNFKATEMLDGFCLVGYDDTVSNITTKTDIINSAFITVLDNYSVFATGFEQAAGMIGLIGDIAQSSPGSGYLNKELAGFLPLSQRIRTERNVLAGGGCATFRTVGTKVILDRTVTTQQKDAQLIAIDVDDTDLRVFLTISYVRYTFVVRMNQYQNYKVGNDDDLYGAGVRVMTPNIYKQNLILNYQQLVSDAVCEDLVGFESSVIVLKVGNRMDSSMQINVINVLLQQAMQIKYEV
jgi:phage tail sheath gpL-like